MSSEQKRPRHITDHFANERTYLAWLRTSFSLLTLGFATNKFAQFLIETHTKSETNTIPLGTLGTRRFGIGMVVIGLLLIAYSTWDYNVNRIRIDKEEFRPNIILIWVVGLISIAFGIGALILLLQE